MAGFHQAQPQTPAAAVVATRPALKKSPKPELELQTDHAAKVSPEPASEPMATPTTTSEMDSACGTGMMQVIDAVETPSCLGDEDSAHVAWADVGDSETLPELPVIGSNPNGTTSTTLSVTTGTRSVASFIAVSLERNATNPSTDARQSIHSEHGAFSKTLNFIAYESLRL